MQSDASDAAEADGDTPESEEPESRECSAEDVGVVVTVARTATGDMN